MTGRIKRKSLKLLEAEGFDADDLFSAVRKSTEETTGSREVTAHFIDFKDGIINYEPTLDKQPAVAKKNSPKKSPKEKKKEEEAEAEASYDTSLEDDIDLSFLNEYATKDSADSDDATSEPKKKKVKKVQCEPTKLKRTYTVAANNVGVKKPCQRPTCKAEPSCFAEVVPGCARDGWTARWYHVTGTEHYCNMCFEWFYRSHRKGHQWFLDWKNNWSTNGRTEGSLTMFYKDQLLPYWTQCIKCKKWRQLPNNVTLTESMSRSYICEKDHMRTNIKFDDPCQVDENPLVQTVLSDDWLRTVVMPYYLQQSIAIPFLSSYYLDGVGVSALASNQVNGVDDEYQWDEDGLYGTHPKVQGVSPFFQPFHQPRDHVFKAFSFPPDFMEHEENLEFPEFQKEHSYQIYLGLRNLVLVAWSRYCGNWLTSSVCIHYIICRGMMRIKCVQLLDRIIAFLTRLGVINIGIVRPPRSQRKARENCSVIVVGAGAAGLAAARHLRNHGVAVQVIEGRNRIGGRVSDNWSTGVCVGKGAQLVLGCINNPFSVMCEQLDLNFKIISEKCDLVSDSGKLVDADLDRRIDFHFNAMLDIVAEWRKDKPLKADISLLEKVKEMHKQFLDESQLTFHDEEDDLFSFHLSNLEYAVGTDLKNVSAISWDQNEIFPQFGGPHMLMADGYSKVLAELAKGTEIIYKKEVISINYGGEQVRVKTADGSKYKAGKILVTVPLAILQRGTINFDPSLPKSKLEAIKGLGCGVIEKVILKFSVRFWGQKLGNAEIFGRLPSSKEPRGLFSLFYDLSVQKDEKSSYVLVSYVSGAAVDKIKDKTDAEVVELCLNTLKNMFPEESVPKPLHSLVTRWGKDKFAGMAYSYIQVGSTGDLYDSMAEHVDKKVFFAGEATHRQFPQTVTGAYCSGIREANKIIEIFEEEQAEAAPVGL